jgi:hypothetical protein
MLGDVLMTLWATLMMAMVCLLAGHALNWLDRTRRRK